jgi:hypothetical protein
MHRGHDHDHDHDHHHHHHGGVSAGHNARPTAAQWQTPHLPPGEAAKTGPEELDIDLVQEAFVASFPTAADPTSFLRLSGVPFIGEAADGTRLSLLRVEISQTTDIGTLTPHLGGTGHRYDPLPAKMASRRQTLALAYFDGSSIRRLSLAEARALKDLTPKR